MTSPYLNRPLRTLAQAARDQLARPHNRAAQALADRKFHQRKIPKGNLYKRDKRSVRLWDEQEG